jgi:hypothetical protein
MGKRKVPLFRQPVLEYAQSEEEVKKIFTGNSYRKYLTLACDASPSDFGDPGGIPYEAYQAGLVKFPDNCHGVMGNRFQGLGAGVSATLERV